MARGEIVKSCEMYVTRYKIINQKLYCYVELDNRHRSLQSVSLLRTAQLHARTFLFGDSDPCASPNKQRNDNTSGISIACPPPCTGRKAALSYSSHTPFQCSLIGYET